MGKFGSPQIGRFANGYTEYDDPKLNKCPKCGALTDSRVCPICHAEIPDDMLAGHRKTAAKINVVYCERCGAENSKGYSKCISCGKKRQKSHKALISVLSIMLMLETAFIGCAFVMANMESVQQTYSQVAKGYSVDMAAVNAMIEQRYKQKCVEIEYSVLARNPDSFKNQLLTVTGEVVQEVDIDGGFFVRMDITQGEYGIWTDTIAATVAAHANGERILEGDIIKIYGECSGLYTYESVFGVSISLPKIDAPYYELVEKQK